MLKCLSLLLMCLLMCSCYRLLDCTQRTGDNTRLSVQKCCADVTVTGTPYSHPTHTGSTLLTPDQPWVHSIEKLDKTAAAFPDVLGKRPMRNHSTGRSEGPLLSKIFIPTFREVRRTTRSCKDEILSFREARRAIPHAKHRHQNTHTQILFEHSGRSEGPLQIEKK